MPDASPDFEAIKTRQQATWSTGNYATIAHQVVLAAELVCETADLKAGSQLLDVACGSGNASLAAARRHCDVTGLDYVPELLDAARARTEADDLEVDYVVGDAEQLPFEDASFDAVLSVFGAMFAPNQEQTASELMRVCRPGGTVAVVSWKPSGFIGGIFKIIGSHVPPPPGLRSPLEWGTLERVTELFGDAAESVTGTDQVTVFRYQSPEHFVEAFRTYYGPMAKAFEALDAREQEQLNAELIAHIESSDRMDGQTIAVPSTYLEVVATRA